jgi:hypothetical protein
MYPDCQQHVEYSGSYCNGDEADKYTAYNGSPNYRMASFSAPCMHHPMSLEARQSDVFRHALTLPSMEMVKAHHEIPTPQCDPTHAFEKRKGGGMVPGRFVRCINNRLCAASMCFLLPTKISKIIFL